MTWNPDSLVCDKRLMGHLKPGANVSPLPTTWWKFPTFPLRFYFDAVRIFDTIKHFLDSLPVRTQSENQFPFSSIPAKTLFQYPIFLISSTSPTFAPFRDRQILTHDGKFREEDFLTVFDEFCKSTGLFAGSKTPSTVAEKCYTTAVGNRNTVECVNDKDCRLKSL